MDSGTYISVGFGHLSTEQSQPIAIPSHVFQGPLT